MIKLIAGLGNPGIEYKSTRHNAGFWFIDLLAQETSASLRVEKDFHGLVGRATLNGQPIWLLKPLTFMNRSGQAVSALARFHRIAVSEILVVHDELDIPPGRARLKLGGGNGGHNGLKDITAAFGDTEFWRLRIGIGHPRDYVANDKQRQQDVAAYVLNPATAQEQKNIDDAMIRAREAVALLLQGNSAAAMQTLHTST